MRVQAADVTGTGSITGSDSDVAVEFLRAWTSGDAKAARSLCHADLRFEGPIDTRLSADEHVTALTRVAAAVTGVTLVQSLEQGDHVVLFYDLAMTPAGTVRIAELNVVRDGRLIEIRAFFDTYPLRGAAPDASS